MRASSVSEEQPVQVNAVRSPSSSARARGVFIQFTEIHRQDKPALEHLIARLSGTESVPASAV